MTLKEKKRELIKTRGRITADIREKIADRDDIRRERERKKKRDPKTEAREQELNRAIAGLCRQEDSITKRIKQLRSRKEEVVAKLKSVIRQLQDATPDFNGHPSNVNPDVKRVIVKAAQYGLVVTSTTDGSSHASTSWHYPQNNPDGLGGAVDLGGSAQSMLNFQQWCYENAHLFRESIGPNNNQMVKNGVRYSLPEGSALENMHDNHNHVAPYPGAFT